MTDILLPLPKTNNTICLDPLLPCQKDQELIMFPTLQDPCSNNDKIKLCLGSYGEVTERNKVLSYKTNLTSGNADKRQSLVIAKSLSKVSTLKKEIIL